MEKNQSPLLSVIVPAYNVEAYLHQCARSVLEQSYDDFELILIDDGATDRSGEICDEFANTDKRVKVLHKLNGGLSDARNAGISLARGRYLMFVDGDDYIAKSALELIAGALARDDYPDVMFIRAVMVYPDGGEKPYGRAFSRGDFFGRDHQSVLGRLTSGGQFHVSACVKVVSKSLCNEAGGFWKGIVGEDVDFSAAVYMAAQSYSALEETCYYYRQQRQGSITAQQTDRRLKDLLRIVDKWVTIARRGHPLSEWIYRFMYHQFYTLLLLYAKAGSNAKTRGTRLSIRSHAMLLRYADGGKIKGPVLRLLFRLAGVRFMSRLLGYMEMG